MRRALAPARALPLLLAAACGTGAPDRTRAASAALENPEVYTRLGPTCVGCHDETSNRPFFVSLGSFESLLAYDTRFVVPGHPEKSVLVDLLLGAGRGGYKQMPELGEPFFKLEAAGKTHITLEEIRAWITALPAPACVAPSADPDAPLVRRKTAEQVVTALYAQLGLTDADFFRLPGYDGATDDQLPVRSPDALPRNDLNGVLDPAFLRFGALGGPSWLDGVRRSREVSPSFLQNLVPISQAYCRMAVEKKSNDAILRKASLADASASTAGAARIRDNIAYLHLRMLGEPASDTEIDDLFGTVFQAYEPEGAVVAWTAVCAALVRDPLWISY